MWAGDQNTTFGRDDGLASVIPIMTHAGLSGIPILGTDIGGYSNFTPATPPTTKELFLRWSSLAALTPLMRTHHGGTECDNWSFDRDGETLDHYRRWARVHVLLQPLFASLARDAVDRGLPFVRHPFLLEPLRPAMWAAPCDAFFLGDDLLVAPVVEAGATSRDVTLPGPGWWPLFGSAPLATTARTDGVVVAHVEAAPTELPVFARPGTVLPLLGEPVDTFYGATEPGITGLADTGAVQRLAIYADSDGNAGVQTAELTATCAGLTDGPPWSWSGAILDGAPLPLCDDAGDGTSCVTADGAWVHVVGGQGLVTLGGAGCTVDGEAARTYRLAIGGAAWGELAAPTALTDLAPDVPPPCE